MREIINQGVWIVPALLLFVATWVKFNRPPTNRSGTMFALFHCGVLFYFALLISLWLLVIVLLYGGGSGLDKLGFLAVGDPQAREQMAKFAPVVAVLIIVVASLFPQVSKIDAAARSFCLSLASIPREADYLAMELAKNAEFNPPSDRLRHQVAETIRENIGDNALNFSNDGSMAARFTRAVSLYSLFILPDGDGRALDFPAKAHARSAYARIMRLNEKSVAQANAGYETLMETALAYFTAAQPTKAMKEALKIAIKELSILVCSLIARFVLYQDRTASQRRKRLSKMGFDTPHVEHTFGSDQWVASILVVMVLSLLIMSVSGSRAAPGEALVIALTFAISIGIAAVAGTFVAQRFIRRDEGLGLRFPPMAELTAAGLVVIGISTALRIGFPLIPTLLTTGSFALEDSVNAFVDRLPGLLVPLICTFSIGLLCSYLGTREWSWTRLALAGAAGNGIAFIAAGFLMLSLLKEELLIKRFGDTDFAKLVIVTSLGVIGSVLGAIVLATFRRSIRAVQATAARGVPSEPTLFRAVLPTHQEGQSAHAENNTLFPRAPKDLGGYLRESVEELEGRYVCFRPTFGNPQVINAYLITIRWDEKRSCLVFEEQNRADSGYVQKGQVYIPDGKPFMNLVTAERGAVRLIMVSRPDVKGYARGLVMTLANSGGVHFTPASAPVVLGLLREEMPHLGFVHPGARDYEFYQSELSSVMPDFGVFTQPKMPFAIEARVQENEDSSTRLTIVR